MNWFCYTWQSLPNQTCAVALPLFMFLCHHFRSYKRHQMNSTEQFNAFYGFCFIFRMNFWHTFHFFLSNGNSDGNKWPQWMVCYWQTFHLSWFMKNQSMNATNIDIINRFLDGMNFSRVWILIDSRCRCVCCWGR